jgi:hypothetical protein
VETLLENSWVHWGSWAVSTALLIAWNQSLRIEVSALKKEAIADKAYERERSRGLQENLHNNQSTLAGLTAALKASLK